ncbi:MAG: transposase [Opitutales bacterium]
MTPRQRQRRDRLLAENPVLGPLYERLCQLHALMNQTHRTKRECRPLIRQLLDHIHALRNTNIAQLQSLGNTLQTWQEPIACMWRLTRNNGITEGFNRKLKLIQRRAYGFRNFYNYRLRAIAQCG